MRQWLVSVLTAAVCLGGSATAWSQTERLVLAESVQGKMVFNVVDTDGRLLGTLPTVESAFSPYFAISDDHSRMVYTVSPGHAYCQVWLYEFATGASTYLFPNQYCQVMRWVPGSNTRFIYGDYGARNLYLYDLDAPGVQPWWASLADSLRGATGRDTVRNGLDFDARFEATVFQAGSFGAGGDGVFLARVQPGEPGPPVTEIRPLMEGPGIARTPVITRAGDSVVFTRQEGGFSIIEHAVADGRQRTLYQDGGWLTTPVLIARETQVAFVASRNHEVDTVVVCERDSGTCRDVYTSPDGYIQWMATIGSANRAPTAVAGADISVEATSPAGAFVRLDGSASSDPDGDPLAFSWTDAGDALLATTATATVQLPLGRHTITLSVDDGNGGLSEDTVVVEVTDTTSPVVTASATCDILWPPNGKMRPVSVTGRAFDAASGMADGVGAFKTVDEYGLIQPSGTFYLSPSGDFAFTVDLEASRRGTDKDGRTYTLTLTGVDVMGNTATTTVVVVVPHDQGK